MVLATLVKVTTALELRVEASAQRVRQQWITKQKLGGGDGRNFRPPSLDRPGPGRGGHLGTSKVARHSASIRMGQRQGARPGGLNVPRVPGWPAHVLGKHGRRTQQSHRRRRKDAEWLHAGRRRPAKAYIVIRCDRGPGCAARGLFARTHCHRLQPPDGTFRDPGQCDQAVFRVDSGHPRCILLPHQHSPCLHREAGGSPRS